MVPNVYPVTMGNNDDSSDSEKYGEDKKDDGCLEMMKKLKRK